MGPPKHMSQVVQQLISFFQARDTLTLHGTKQGMKSLKPILKHLYTLLCSLVSYEICQGNCGSGSATNGFELERDDMTNLSNVLFKELHNWLPTFSDNASVYQNIELEVRNIDEKDSREELLLLLRCCVLMVRCNPYDQLNNQFQGIVALLHKLCTTGRLARKQMKLANGSAANSPYLYMRFLQQMLEVFLDELFADRTFRECIARFESLSLTYQNQCVRSSIQIESALEIIATHFLLSISERNVVETFAESLVWMEDSMVSSPEVSLRVVSSLVHHPVMTSAPTLLISHLISLASEVIGIRIPDATCGNIYLSTFCDSVSLYCKHISKLIDFRSPGRIVQSSFESYFHSENYQKINFVLGIFGNTQRVQSGKICKKTPAIMENDAISYIAMHIKIVDEAYRNNVFSFLSLLISRVVSIEMSGHLLQSVEKMTKQDHCLLASILKLMSCSLLQATHCFELNLSSVIALMKGKDALPFCKSQVGLMSFFSQSNFNIPVEVQQVVVDALKPHLSTCKEFELIFVHFAGLLSVCIFIGLDVLVKGCLFLLLVLLNSLAMELGSLEFLKPSVAANSETPACRSTFDIAQKKHQTCVRQTSSFRIASNFHRERQKLLRDLTGSEVSDEETCNGEIYLRYLIGNPNTTDDYEELADFIECKPYRDYNARVSYHNKRQFRKYEKSSRRLHLAMMEAYSSGRRRSKRKSTRKACESESESESESD